MAGKRILQVEDHQDTADLVEIVLQRDGYQVETVSTSEQAKEAIQRKHFDLYLLDNLLPDGNGIDLCREVRKRDWEVPIIFYSAAGYKSDQQRAMEAGANRYLLKPVDLNELMKVIEDLLDKPSPKGSKTLASGGHS
ncbi:MAG TPA: response regulator [Blastocatellia bacterium]|nr:response regulator [Blastocatellia bacterium]